MNRFQLKRRNIFTPGDKHVVLPAGHGQVAFLVQPPGVAGTEPAFLVHREMKLKDLPRVFLDSAWMMGAIFMLLVLAIAFNKFLTEEQVHLLAAAVDEVWLTRQRAAQGGTVGAIAGAAGGMVSALDGAENFMESGHILCGSPRIYRELAKLFAPDIKNEKKW